LLQPDGCWLCLRSGTARGSPRVFKLVGPAQSIGELRCTGSGDTLALS